MEVGAFVSQTVYPAVVALNMSQNDTEKRNTVEIEIARIVIER